MLVCARTRRVDKPGDSPYRALTIVMRVSELAPEVSVVLSLVGAPFDPSAVTAMVGIQPTRAYRAGDAMSVAGGRRRRDMWSVSIGPRDTAEVPGMVEELLQILRPVGAQLQAACAAFGLEPVIYCAVTLRSRLTPVLRFTPETLVWAAEHGAAIDVDVMVWSDSEELPDEADESVR